VTREEAIKRLDWLRMVGNHVDSVTLGKEDMPFFDMAIAALREQEERSKGCGHCLSEINKDMMLAHGFAHCTDCGRRLEEHDGQTP